MATEATASSPVRFVGVDLGAQKSIVVEADGEIIRTTTGSVSRPTLVSFSNCRRVFGEEAYAQITAEYTLPLLTMMVGKTLEDIKAQPWSQHLRVPVESDEEGRLFLTLNHDLDLDDGADCSSDENGNSSNDNSRFYLTALLGSYIANIAQQVGVDNIHYCFNAFTPNAGVYRHFQQACQIAGLSTDAVSFVDPTATLIAAYARKIVGLGGPESAGILGKHVLLVDVGHCQTSMVLVSYASVDQALPTIISRTFTDVVGSYQYDLLLFNHFAKFIQDKYKTTVTPGSKKGLRLLLACERLRKLLSQLPESNVVVENVCENMDISLHLTRDEMSSICASLNQLLHQMIHDSRQKECSAAASSAEEGEVPATEVEVVSIDAIEVSGGGCRMPHIQLALLAQLPHLAGVGGNPNVLGAKLNDSSNAYGAVLCVTQHNLATNVQNVEDGSASPAFSAEQLTALIAAEQKLQLYGNKLDQINTMYNQIEAMLLKMKNIYKSNGAVYEGVEKNTLYQCINNYEHLVYEVMESGLEYHRKHAGADATEAEMTLQEPISAGKLDRKLQFLRNVYEDGQVEDQRICGVYYEKLAQQRAAVEQELATAAAEENEDGEDGGYDKDNDNTVNRKLKKSDRLRLIQKNKEEGNELFKDNNYKLAVIRYQKAIGHINMLFEQNAGAPVTAEEKVEMDVMKVNLFNNIALAYTKMENWELVLTHVNNALTVDKSNKKALYRRGCYWELHKKDMDKAWADYKACADMIPSSTAASDMSNEDKLITKAVDRVKKEMQKLKDKEKKMWGKAFA